MLDRDIRPDEIKELLINPVMVGKGNIRDSIQFDNQNLRVILFYDGVIGTCIRHSWRRKTC